jgi:hypothetical protein
MTGKESSEVDIDLVQVPPSVGELATGDELRADEAPADVMVGPEYYLG